VHGDGVRPVGAGLKDNSSFRGVHSDLAAHASSIAAYGVLLSIRTRYPISLTK
jgi:hypothetical protein